MRKHRGVLLAGRTGGWQPFARLMEQYADSRAGSLTAPRLTLPLAVLMYG